MAKAGFTIGTTATVLLANTRKEILAITNYSATADVFVSVDGEATVTDGNGASPGILVPPRSTLTLGRTYGELRAPDNQIVAVASAAGTRVGIQYW